MITTVLPSVEDYKGLPQNTPAEIFTQIAKDLLLAADKLPVSITASEKGRVSKAAAQALIAIFISITKVLPNRFLVNRHGAMAAKLSIKLMYKDYSSQSSAVTNIRWSATMPSFGVGRTKNNEESILEIQYSEKAKSGDWGGWNINGNFSSVWIGPRNLVGDPTAYPLMVVCRSFMEPA